MTSECADGLDNDDDGTTDLMPSGGETADPGCQSADDNREQDDPLPECSNGFDDDGDDKIDFLPPVDQTADPGCDSAQDNLELDGAPNPDPACSNGEDDDGDEKIDYAPAPPATMDPGCSSGADLDEGSEGLLLGQDTNPAAVSTTPLSGFPVGGSGPTGSYAILSSGDSTFADDPNDSDGTGQTNGDGPGTETRGASVHDLVTLKIDIAGTGANCLSVDFRFLSEEFPEFVGSTFNDAFLVELDGSDFTIDTTPGVPNPVNAPRNFAFDSSGQLISINTAGFSAEEAAGTTYDGATPLLRAVTPITPGPHSIYVSVFDQGDSALDSAAFVDNLRVFSVPTGSCSAGATPDATPPETTITSGPAGTTDDATPTFAFSSSESGSSFQCRIDSAPFTTCTDPHTTSALVDGSHTFEVRAVDAVGNVDPTPASRSFTVDTSTPPDTSADYVVNSPADGNDGACNSADCTLREAIMAANAAAGAQTIAFAIPGTGVRLIQPASALPEVTGPTTVDATTQAGYTGSPLVRLEGVNVPPTVFNTYEAALTFLADNNTLKGLSITRWQGQALVFGGANNVIEANYVGVAPDGTAAGNGYGVDLTRYTGAGGNNLVKNNVISGNAQFGVQAAAGGNSFYGNKIGTDPTGSTGIGPQQNVGIQSFAGGEQIGGTAAGQANVISGNFHGVVINSSTRLTKVEGNKIGTNALGTAAVPNQFGVVVYGPATIGGTAAGAGNVISGNSSRGVQASQAFVDPFSLTIQGNYVGTNAAGDQLGNGVGYSGGGVGVFLNLTTDAQLGGTAAGAGNVIAYNGGSGVWIRANLGAGYPATGNSVLGNSIYDNASSGILLDGGANGGQQAASLTRARPDLVRGTFTDAPNTGFTVEVFASPLCNGSGKRLVARTSGTTDGAGQASFSVSPSSLDLDEKVTATVTDAAGNTSQFSNCLTATARQPGALRFSSTSYSSDEDAGAATITVTRTGGSEGSVSVDYLTSNGTATAGSDYTASSGTLTFADGETSKTFAVSITDDSLDEVNETVALTLSSAGGGATLGTPAAATLTIGDNDPAPSLSIDSATVTEPDSGTVNATFTVSLSAASGKPVSVGYHTVDGTAIAPADFTAASGTLSFAPGETAKTVSVAVVGDNRDEADETFRLRLSNASNAVIGDGSVTATIDGNGTISDNDPAPTLSVGDTSIVEGHSGSKDLVFTIALSAASGKTVTVAYETADGTATAGSDYTGASGTVTFQPGETQKTVSVAVSGDTTVEPDETLNLDLATANDANATVADGRGQATLGNDDSGFRFSQATYTVSESVGQATITVQRFGYVGTATVDYQAADDTATAPADYTAASGTLSFAAGDTEKTFLVTVADDSGVESGEAVRLALSNPNAGELATPSSASLIINDNDIAPDTTPPLAPSALTPTSATTTSVSVSWSASTDNVGVAGYDLFLNGAKVATISGTSSTLSGLACGTTYTIGVEAFDAAGNRSGRTTTAVSTVSCAAPPPPPPPLDSTPPDTRITAGPASPTTKRKATFRFTATESGSTFKCKLDRGAWSPCSSPKTYRNLKKGKHVFQVRATDALGNVDSTPAKRTWRIR